MINDIFSLREQEIFRALKEIKGCDFVIIGGYAVNAYTLPRFSVDCDIVIKDERELNKIDKILVKIGYARESIPKEAQYSGSFCRYEKRLENNFIVSVDILIKNVVDRGTEAAFSADWVFENSKIMILKGRTINEEIRVRIINIDALIAMKTISCRSTDIRDVFMMIPNADNKEWIKSEISSRYELKDRLSRMIEKVDSRQFKDGLSGVYGRIDEKTFEKHRKAVLSLMGK